MVMSKDPEIWHFHVSKQYFRMVCKLPVDSGLCLEDFLADLNFSVSYYLGDAMLRFNLEGIYVVVLSVMVFVLRRELELFEEFMVE